MTLEQYKEKLDEELKAMDWHERDIKNSRAYKVLSAAALPLSGDEVRRKIEAAKAQMDTGAYRRRG